MSASPNLPMLDVLLLDAQQRQTLTSLRSLDRAGLRVGVAACVDHAAAAPAMHSRRSDARSTLAELGRRGAFTDSLIALLDDRPARAIIPAHDGTIEAIRSRRADLAQRTHLALAGDAALEIAVSKSKTLRVAERLGIATPRAVELCAEADVVPAVAAIGLPIVVKPDSSWVERNGTGSRVASYLAHSVAETQYACELIVAAGGRVLLQQWLPGRRDAVSLFIVGDSVRARFAQTSYREYPALGGVTVLCEGLPLIDDIVTPAEHLALSIGLDGPSMIEFRRDATGRPVLMEVNPRMGGSVSLAIRSGVDFPRLTYDWAIGEAVPEITSYRVGRRVRWLSVDLWNLKKSFDSPGLPDVPNRRRALVRFIADFAVRPSAIEPFDSHDLMPAIVDLAGNVLGPVKRKLTGRRMSANPIRESEPPIQERWPAIP